MMNQTEIRTRRMAYAHVMDDVKPINPLPNLDVITLSMAADYFGISTNDIGKYYASHKRELGEYGIATLKVDDFSNAGYQIEMDGVKKCYVATLGDTSARISFAGVRVMSKLALFNMALGISGSDVAEQIKGAAGIAETESGVNNVEPEGAQPQEEPEIVVESKAEIIPFEPNKGVRVFNNPEFGSFRTVEINGDPWFVGKDVTQVLGYSNPSEALSKHVDADDKLNSKTLSSCSLELGQRGGWLINESGLYSLILSSKLPSAKKFKRWVTSEVLPSLRKHGGYIVGQEQMSTEEFLSRALLFAQSKIEDRDAKIAEQSVTIKALSEDLASWDKRSVINALIRSYAARCVGGNFAMAFSDFYRQYDYKFHTRLKGRRPEGSKKSLLEFLNESELENAVHLAASMCENAGVNVAEVINEVNAEAIAT